MARKVITGIIAAVLVGAIALFAAEKAQKKESAERPKQEAKAVEMPKHKEALLDQLIVAYKANDREEMGEIIKKMEQRREKMREFAKFNRWHQWAHRGMGPEGCGWRQGQAMGGNCPAGPGWQMPCGGPPCQRPCCGGGMGGWGPPAGQCRPMPGCGMQFDGQRRQGPPCGAMGGWGAPACGNRPMRGRGNSPPQGCGQGAGPAWDMPSCEAPPRDVPPPESDW